MRTYALLAVVLLTTGCGSKKPPSATTIATDPLKRSIQNLTEIVDEKSDQLHIAGEMFVAGKNKPLVRAAISGIFNDLPPRVETVVKSSEGTPYAGNAKKLLDDAKKLASLSKSPNEVTPLQKAFGPFRDSLRQLANQVSPPSG